MSDFKREERYIVVKLKDIDSEETEALREFIQSWQIPTRECVVVEPDWPNYEDAWRAIEQVAKDDYQSPYAIIESQQARIAELEQALIDDSVAKIMLEKMTAENEQLDIKLSGNIFHVFCQSFVRTFESAGAENYLTMEFHSDEIGDFTITMQRSQGLTVYEKLKVVEQERDELSATVERLRDAGTKLRDDIDLSKIVGAGKRNFANEWDDVISATPASNLNHVKRAVFADGYYKGFSDAWDSNHDWQQDHINYGLERSEIVAEQEYPSDKDGE